MKRRLEIPNRSKAGDSVSPFRASNLGFVSDFGFRISGFRRSRRGFTLVEMMTAMLASMLVFLAVVGMLAANQKGFNQTYQRVHGEVVLNAQEARSIFERIVRKATYRKVVIGGANEYAEVYYFDDPNTSTALDAYTRFYLSGTTLLAEHGQLEPGTFNYATGNTPTTQTVAQNVTSAQFTQAGSCVSMFLVLNDGKVDLPVTVTATRHNE